MIRGKRFPKRGKLRTAFFRAFAIDTRKLLTLLSYRMHDDAAFECSLHTGRLSRGYPMSPQHRRLHNRGLYDEIAFLYDGHTLSSVPRRIERCSRLTRRVLLRIFSPRQCRTFSLIGKIRREEENRGANGEDRLQGTAAAEF